MRLARVEGPDGVAYGSVHQDRIELLTAAPWHGGVATGARLARQDARLLVPVEPSKVVGIGRNYHDHIREMGYAVPDRPSIFLKPPSALVATGEPVVLPPPTLANEVQYEAELAVVIGTSMRDVDAASALDHVYGYTNANDISARDLQRQDGSPIRAKAFDTFCPLGPWIETQLDITGGVGVRCWVDDELRQHGNTADLVFDVPTLLSILSRIMTLLPGDIVLTGTPGGCADLHDGERMRVEIEGIGSLENPVAATPTG